MLTGNVQSENKKENTCGNQEKDLELQSKKKTDHKRI